MSRVLLIGGSRFIGKEIARQARAAGHEVALFNRGVTAPEGPAVKGDVKDLERHAPRLRALKPDVVVHCIAYTEKDAADCVAVFAGTGARVIVLSSMDCYDAFQNANRGLETSDFPVDESMPTTPIRHYWRGFAHPRAEDYDRNLMTDRFLAAQRAGSLPCVVLRLPMVYGPEDPQYRHRHGEAIRRIYDKERSFPISSRDQARLGTHGYVENVAAAVVHCFASDKAAGRVYNIGEGSVRTQRRWADLFAKAAGWEFDFQVLPEELMAKDRKSRNRPAQHLVFDCSLFIKETAFSSPVGLEEGIAKTLAWGLAHPDALGPRPDYAAERRLVAAYGRAMDGLRAMPRL